MELLRDYFTFTEGLPAFGATGFFTWIGIALCLSQSAMFSGLNLAIFSVSRLRLEVEAAGGNRDAVRVLDLREDSHHFLRDTLFDTVSAAPEAYWHRPITVTDPQTRLGEVIPRMYVRPERPEDDVIDHDLILLWGEHKRIITGADLLGRLLRGIAGTGTAGACLSDPGHHRMAAESPLRVLFATPELAPWAQSGGLGDVSTTLPPAVQRLGVDVRVLVPGYTALLVAYPGARVVAHWPCPAGALAPARLLAAQGAAGVPLLIIDCPEFYGREGTPYADAGGRDWPDNHLRFGLLSRVAALLASQASPLPWRPHLLQCHDWPAGLAPAYLHFEPGARAATVMTVHNLAFQGIYPAGTLGVLGIPAEAFHIDGVEFHGKLSFLKAGLGYADSVTTVSPTYAREIQTQEHGCGLDGVLRARGDRLAGILNGIDASVWNPASDPHLAARYDISRMEGKALDKAALQRELGLRVDRETPLVAFIGRLTHQKGLDLLARIVPDIIAMPAQLVVLGRGERDLEREFTALASRFPEACAAAIRFDEALAHRIEAGADILVMPSRFEPCGLNQM